MMARFLMVSILATFFSGCLRLDSQLFNGKKVTEYKWDDYTGTKEIASLSDTFKIDGSKQKLLTLQSNSKAGTATIYAVYLGDESSIATDTVILYCHGNADHMDRYWNRAKLLAYTGSKHRYGVLMFDYRGYGMSEGTPDEESIYADTDACLKWLQSKGLTGDRLMMYGFSLGTSAATEITANNFTLQPAKLILEAPFASAEVMVQDGSKLALPGSYFTNNKIDNAEEIKKVKVPFMWIHGTIDDFLSIKTHGEVVYKNYNGVYKEAHRIAGGNHSDVPAIWGYANYSQALLNFITKP